MKYLFSILSLVLPVKSEDMFNPRTFNIFCTDYLSIKIDQDNNTNELLDRNSGEDSKNFQDIEIIFKESENSKISFENDNSENILIRIQDDNGTCNVLGRILGTNLTPVFKYNFKDIKFIIKYTEDTKIKIKCPDFESKSSLYVESYLSNNIFYKGDLLLSSSKNLNISYGYSHHTKLELRFTSIEAIFSLSCTCGEMNITEEGSEEQIIKLINGGTFDLKFDIDNFYKINLRKKDIKNGRWFNFFGYFY